MIVTHKYFLKFPKCETETPIVYHLVKDYDLEVNIFRAKVTSEGEGYLVLDLKGKEVKIAEALKYVASFGVSIDTIDKGVIRDDSLCTHCGNCLSHCKPKALHLADPVTRQIAFDEKLCIACGRCIDNCPMKACSSLLE